MIYYSPSRIFYTIQTSRSTINILILIFLTHLQVLYDIRANDELVSHAYLTKYKEKLFNTIKDPFTFYIADLSVFVRMTASMSVKSEALETAPQELEALSEIFGAEGLSWVTAQIGEIVSARWGRQGRDRDTWKLTDQNWLRPLFLTQLWTCLTCWTTAWPSCCTW